MKRRPTLEDVATLAGVSTATVSNLINGTKFISDPTKVRINQAIETLDYIPNNLAKSLKIRDSKLIGLLISDFANPFFPPVVRGIEEHLAKNGYNLLLSDTNSDSQIEKKNLRVLLSRRIDGLLVSLAGKEEEHFHNIYTPTVFFNRVPHSDKFSKVQVKNFKATYIGTQHLIDHGYKKIAMIAGPQHLNVGKDRLNGYIQALLDNGMEANPVYQKVSKLTVEQGYAQMKSLMELQDPPEAVLTGNNAFSLGAFSYLKETKHKIPSDIAFIGYDDTDWATIVDPPLTVIRYPMYVMGEAIASMILDQVQNKGTPSIATLNFEPELVIRQSCGCNMPNEENSQDTYKK
ncbi:MAG: LacI family DNA-binding transcriptional regulator [Sphaerochaeta sp.]